MSSLLDPSSSYTPVYHPIQPHRSLKLTPSLSTRKAHFRRCYDIYHVALQRNDIAQAKKAYSILVRCKEFDWAANWRSGLEMVNLSSSNFNGEGEDDQDPSYTNQGHDDDDDVTLNEQRMRMREKRLFLLKIDYLRECHIIHSRKAKKKHSLREPEAILLQIVLLLASANKHAEALNELELYLPVSPYRDNALLHYYAGLLCIYLAQLEVLQDNILSSQNLLGFVGGASGSTSNGHASLFSQVQYGPSSSFSSSLPSTPGVRSRSSSTSSSTNSSDSSSSSEMQMTGSKKTNHNHPSSSNFKSHHRHSSSSRRHSKKNSNSSHHHHHNKITRSFNQLAHSHIKDALQISNYPTPELIKKIMQIASGNGSMYGNDARKWFELAKRIADEKGCRFDEVDEWLGLLNGQSIEETRSLRKLEFMKDVLPPTSHNENASSASHPSSASKWRRKSTRSTSSYRKTARTPSSSTASQSHLPNGARDDDDDDEDTFTLPPLASLPSSSRTFDSETDNDNDARSHNSEDANDDEEDDEENDGEYDPFGRTRQESKKRKRNGAKMVTFASIDEAFDLSMSD